MKDSALQKVGTSLVFIHVHSCYMQAKQRGNPFPVLSLKNKDRYLHTFFKML